MSDHLTFTLSIPADAPLPAVMKIPLDGEVFARLSAEMKGSAVFAVNEAAGAEFACQLSDESLTASPQGTDREPALHILVSGAPLPLETELTLTAKPPNEARPADRRYNPWSELPGVYMDHQKERARVVVSIEGKLFTRYLYSADVAKPYYYPLIGPAGKTVIQDGPDDHLHHHGLWWGHDDVGGHKLYHEFRGEGRQAHREFLTLTGGPVFGQITSLIDWLDENGRMLLQETRTVRIYNLPPESRYVDLTTQLHAVNGEVRFGDTKEGGFPFIRMNEQLSVHHTGTITAANGKTGESDVFGSVTEWVDYSGKLFLRMNREAESPSVSREYIDAGIAVFAHPHNEDYAKQWFVRDYGPFTPANFHFCGGKTLPQGESIAMRHRLYIHGEDRELAGVRSRYREYASAVQ